MFYIIWKEDKKRLDNLKIFQWVKLNMDILKHAWPEFVREIIRNIQAVQNDVLKKSTKIRDINWLAYSDWASDFADKLKFELTQVLNKIVADPNLFDPITGKKIKTKK